MSKGRTLFLFIEMAICLGPTFLYLLSGIVLFPHQLILVVKAGSGESVFPLLYFVGISSLLVGVLSIRQRLSSPPTSRGISNVTRVCLSVGVMALFLGPVGTFVLGHFEDISLLQVIVFVAMPLLCVVHLYLLAQGHVTGE